MSDAITTCKRELVLYKDPKLQDLVTRLYVALIETSSRSHKLYSRQSSLLPYQPVLWRQQVEKPMAEVRRISQAVLREVDYQHRVELRETSTRVVDLQIEQRKILTTLKDQKLILQSLQEERRIISVVQEQQKILQILQNIQGALQTRGINKQTRS